VALRFLREGRMQTLLIIVGVAAGVAVVAYISALITGLQSNTLEKTLGAQAHVTLSALDDVVVAPGRPASGATTLAQTQPRAQRPRSVANWQALVPVLEAMPEVAAVSPMVPAPGLALRGEATKSIALVGVDLDRYDRIVHLRSKVVEPAVRGWAGRSHHRPRPGDRPGRARRRPRDGAPGNVSDSVRVTALVDLGVRELNRRTVIVPLRAAQSLLGLPGGATNLDLTLVDVWAAHRRLADDLRRVGPTRWRAGSRPMRSWCRR
jgi:lipoprotein-releasing system permease protein